MRFEGPFSQLWTLEDTRTAREAEENAPPSDNRDAYSEWFKTHFHPLLDKIEVALKAHLIWLAEHGRLARPEHLEHARVLTHRWWNNLIDGEQVDDAVENLIGKGLGRSVSTMALFSRKGTPEEAHEKVCRLMEEGTFRYTDMGNDQCQVTGEYIHYEVRNWKLVPGLLKPGAEGGFSRILVPLEADTLKPPGVEHVEVAFPSGHLLMADWFRFDEFTALAKAAYSKNAQGYEISINSAQGAATRTQDMAHKLGFVHVCVDNTCPEVWVDGNTLRVGYSNIEFDEYEAEDAPNAPAGQSPGSFCTDLWWASIIDRQVLLAHLATATGDAGKAEEMLEQYLKDRGNSVLQAQIKPGTYHLYFSGNREDFEAQIAEYEVDFQGFSEPFFIVSPEPIPKRQPVRKMLP